MSTGAVGFFGSKPLVLGENNGAIEAPPPRSIGLSIRVASVSWFQVRKSALWSALWSPLAASTSAFSLFQKSM
jgi:hypothetical protein